MKSRVHLRWQTPFGRVVSDLTVPALVQALSGDERTRITGGAIYHWIRGDTIPRPAVAMRIVEVARGRITLSDVYQHRVQIRQLARQYRIARRGNHHAH